MRVYGMAYGDTMKLPMRAFWHLSGSVPRVLAGERRDQLEMSTIAAHNPQAASDMMEELQKLAPEPVQLTVHAHVAANSVRDQGGFEDLRSM